MRGTRALAAVATAAGLSVAAALFVATSSSAATVAARSAPTIVARTVSAKVPFSGASPARVQSLSIKAMKGATSFRVTAHEVQGDDVSDLDLVVGRTGASGTVTEKGAGTLHVMLVKSTVYAQGDAAYWAAHSDGKQKMSLLAGKWIGIRGNNKSVQLMRAVLTPGFWLAAVTEAKSVRRVPGKVVQAVPTVGLVSSDSTVYVAAKGAPYPLLLVRASNPADTIAFSDRNRKVSFKAPKTFAVVSLGDDVTLGV